MPERFLPVPANILLVDDRKENLAVLKHYLEAPEVRLVTASSGQQALREVLQQDFALILLDVVMPDMSGFEVANHLKAVERTRHIPIIFLTAYAADVAQIFEAYSVGAVDYLVKPVDRIVVRKKAEVFVDLHRQRRELLYQEAKLRAAERRELELRVAELRVASDRRYRALVQGIEHAIAWTAEPGPDGWRLTFVSDQAGTLLEYEPEELATPDFMSAHLHPEDRAPFLATLQAARERHSDESCVHRLIARDGRAVWFRTVVSGHVEDPDHGSEVHGLSLDVTELKRGELTQRFLADAAAVLSGARDFHAALEELARFVVPDLADGCVVEVVREEGLEQLTAVHVDPAAEARAREVGREQEPSASGGAGEVLRTGRTVLHAEPPAGPGQPPAPLGAAYSRVLRALSAHAFIALPLRPRGELRAVVTLVASSPERRFGPAEVALAEELVTRSALIVDNARLYDEARQATRARDELLAVVSHDLKNPLSAIALGARRIETLDPALPPSQTLASARTAASRIHRAASRMERLLNDLLDMERIQTQRLRLEPQVQDAADLMNEAGELLAPVAATRSIALRMENEAPRELRIEADTERLLQVFWNLVGNAIKFTPEGGTIVVRLATEDSWARFTVTDSGPGLKGEQLQRVFEPRWQAEGEGARQGLGLGLAIAKGIVEAHGGRIWAENASGRGACFSFLLPAAAAGAEDARREPPQTH